MKPSFATYAPNVTQRYNKSTGEWVRFETGKSLSHYQSVSGSNNKNLRPCSPYSFHHILNEWVHKTTTYEYVGTKLMPTAYRDGPSVPLWSMVKTIKYGSLSEAQSKVFGQSLNLAMTAKDIIDANKMASDYFGRVAKAAPFLRKKQFGKALKAFFGTKSKSRSAANSWLEFQFGVLPTIHAVQDVYNHASMGIKANRGRLLRLRSVSRNLQIQDNSPLSYWDVIPEHSIVSTFICYRYLSKQDFLQNMSRFNLVEVGWDATPWSFLIDWFVPVGDYLSQFGSITTFTTDGCDSVKIEEEERGVLARKDTGFGFTMHSVQRSDVSFTRSVNSTLSLNMTLSEMIQRSKLNISCRRTVTAFALARQRIGRK